MVLGEMTRVRRACLCLGGDAVRGGLGLHAWRGAGVRRLGLWPRGGLRGTHLVTEGLTAQSLALEVGVWGLGHLLLGAHGAAVLGRRAPTQVLLLLKQPLVQCLLEQSLGGLRLGGALRGLGLLRGAAYSRTRTPLSPLVAHHGILVLLLLLLLHLKLVLMLEPLLEHCSSLLLGHRAGVALLLLPWLGSRLLLQSRLALTRLLGGHARLAHVALLLELGMVPNLLLLLLLL